MNITTLDASIPELAAFIKVGSLSDYVFDPFQEVQSAHYPIKALGILKREQKQNHLTLLISVSKLLLKHRNRSLLNTMNENPNTLQQKLPQKNLNCKSHIN